MNAVTLETQGLVMGWAERLGGELVTLSVARAAPVGGAVHARCSATNDDEHAVSVVMLGPRRSSRYETRPLITLPAPPVTT